jgi:mono/diheme cytochrome c family protein
MAERLQHRQTMRSLLHLALVWAAILLVDSSRSVAGPTPSVSVLNGRLLYREYCSSCHGIAGKGDGPDASIFEAQPRNLREGFLTKYKTDELVRRVREGKPLELALDLPALRARAADVEALAAYLMRLPGIDWELAGRGEDVFSERCVLCHGPTGRPGPSPPAGVARPRDLSDPSYQKSVTDADLIVAVRHGRDGMPGLTPRVSEEDARALVAYVRLLSPGYEQYSKYCAACHGDDGHGNANLAEAINRPTVAFTREYFVHTDPEALRANAWHMVRDQKPVMPHFRVLLTEAQARAIVEYLQRTD